MVMVDLDARMTVAYVMNQTLQGRSGDHRGLGIVLAAYEALEGLAPATAADGDSRRHRAYVREKS